ncbi:MAG: DASH family cryptochrome [Flavobacteriaceae bacterium]
MQKIKKTALIWFRNDLRTFDNGLLTEATRTYEHVMAYYSLDPRHYSTTRWGFKKTERFRAQFLLDSLTDLKEQLKELGIPFYIDQGLAEESIPERVATFGVAALYFQEEWTEEEAQVADAVLKNIPRNIDIYQQREQFLFHPDDVPIQIENLPEVFTVFRKKCEKYGTVKPLASQPSKVQPLSEWPQPQPIPSLLDLGLSEIQIDTRSAFPFKGGSQAGYQRLEHYFWKTKKLSYYKNTRNGLLGLDYSSKFSPWLANGSLSPRQIYWAVKDYEKEIQKNSSTYWLVFELIWRDYFKYISLKHGHKIFKLGGILDKSYRWKTDTHLFVDWANGETPEPFVNANMIELKQTGWMSNRGRQNVASYFAKNLWMDWRMGAAYFESLLLDYDVHSNYGNWMYVAGVGNDPRDRKFDVAWQAERYDPESKYQNRWLQQTLFP